MCYRHGKIVCLTVDLFYPRSSPAAWQCSSHCSSCSSTSSTGMKNENLIQVQSNLCEEATFTSKSTRSMVYMVHYVNFHSIPLCTLQDIMTIGHMIMTRTLSCPLPACPRWTILSVRGEAQLESSRSYISAASWLRAHFCTTYESYVSPLSSEVW